MTDRKNYQAAYRTILEENFPSRLEMRFGDGDEAQSIVYDKVQWTTACAGNTLRGSLGSRWFPSKAGIFN